MADMSMDNMQTMLNELRGPLGNSQQVLQSGDAAAVANLMSKVTPVLDSYGMLATKSKMTLEDISGVVQKLSSTMSTMNELNNLRDKFGANGAGGMMSQGVGNMARVIGGGASAFRAAGRGDFLGAGVGIDAMARGAGGAMGSFQQGMGGMLEKVPAFRSMAENRYAEMGINSVGDKSANQAMLAMLKGGIGGGIGAGILGIAAAPLAIAGAMYSAGSKTNEQYRDAGIENRRSTLKYNNMMGFGTTADPKSMYGGTKLEDGKYSFVKGMRGDYAPLTDEGIGSMMNGIAVGSRRTEGQVKKLATMESVAQNDYGMGSGELSKLIGALEKSSLGENLQDSINNASTSNQGAKIERGDFINAVISMTKSMQDANPALKELGKNMINANRASIGMFQNAGYSAGEGANAIMGFSSQLKGDAMDATKFAKTRLLSGYSYHQMQAGIENLPTEEREKGLRNIGAAIGGATKSVWGSGEELAKETQGEGGANWTTAQAADVLKFRSIEKYGGKDLSMSVYSAEFKAAGKTRNRVRDGNKKFSDPVGKGVDAIERTNEYQYSTILGEQQKKTIASDISKLTTLAKQLGAAVTNLTQGTTVKLNKLTEALGLHTVEIEDSTTKINKATDALRVRRVLHGQTF